MSPAAKYWTATITGVVIFAIAFVVFSSSNNNASIMHWCSWAAAGIGWAIYYYVAAWIARCPACGARIYRDGIFSDIAPTCPTCGRDRYVAHAEGDHA